MTVVASNGLPITQLSIAALLLTFSWLPLHVQLTSRRVSILARSFRNLFHALIYSTKYRWWNIHFNSEFLYSIIVWKRNPINRVKERFAGSVMVFVFQFYQQKTELPTSQYQTWRCTFTVTSVFIMLMQKVRKQSRLCDGKDRTSEYKITHFRFVL
jgi:hypothetical protein